MAKKSLVVKCARPKKLRSENITAALAAVVLTALSASSDSAVSASESSLIKAKSLG
jgi:hypothetical protein